jgi:hypothetical protein
LWWSFPWAIDQRAEIDGKCLPWFPLETIRAQLGAYLFSLSEQAEFKPQELVIKNRQRVDTN